MMSQTDHDLMPDEDEGGEQCAKCFVSERLLRSSFVGIIHVAVPLDGEKKYLINYRTYD